jgi:hypothetical protein
MLRERYFNLFDVFVHLYGLFYFPRLKSFRRAFLCFQNCPIVLAALSNHSRSASSAMSSTAQKNFTTLELGLPNGRSLPAVTRTATTSGLQFNSFATCSEQSGRQIFCRPSRHRRLCQFVSHTSIRFGHRNSTSYPVQPAIHPTLRAGWGGRPCRVP